MQYPQTAYSDFLQTGISSVALSMTITTTAPTRTQGILTLGRDIGNREDVYYTNVTGNVITIGLRGLSQTALTPTEVSGNKKVHAANELVEMTTHHNYATNFARLDEDQTISGVNTFSTAGNAFTFAPKVPGLLDPSGNEAIDTPATASAVNQFKVQNSATGQPVILTTAGDDTNINLELQAKGSGIVVVEDGAQTKTNAAPVADKDLVNKLYADTINFSVTDFQEATATYGASVVGTDAYAIAPTPALAGYTDGQTFRVKWDVANTGAATLAVSALAAKPISKGNDVALETGDLVAGGTGILIYKANWNTGSGAWLLSTPSSATMSTANSNTLTGGVASNADALHTHTFVEKIVTVPTAVTVNTTNAETNLLSQSIPANTLSTNNAVRVVMWISDFDLLTTDTATLRFKYGGNTYVTLSLANNASGGTITNLTGKIEFLLMANGATNNQVAFADATLSADIVTGAGTTTNIAQAHDGGAGNVATDSTSAQTLAITVQFSTSSANNSISMFISTIEVIA